MFHFCCQSNVYSWNNIVFIVLAFDNLSLLGKCVRIHPTVSATKKNSHICFANICIMDKRTVAKCKLESFVLLEKKIARRHHLGYDTLTVVIKWYIYWQNIDITSHQKKVLKRIKILVESVQNQHMSTDC